LKVYLQKNHAGLIPVSPEAKDWFDKLKEGQFITVDAAKTRNYMLLRKYFALLNIAYDNWKQPENQVKVAGQMVTPAKNFEQFRGDLTLLCGYYETVFRLDGGFRHVPKSISFANMSEEDFNKLYQTTITVLIEYVYPTLGVDDVKEIVDTYLTFA
jgi:hypothetical protein